MKRIFHFILAFSLIAVFSTVNLWTVQEAKAEQQTFTMHFKNVNVPYITEIRVESRKRAPGGYMPLGSIYAGPRLDLKQNAIHTFYFTTYADTEFFKIFVGCKGVKDGSSDQFQRGHMILHRDQGQTAYNIDVILINNDSKVSFDCHGDRWNYAN